MSNDINNIDKDTLYSLAMILKPTTLRLYIYMLSQCDDSGLSDTSFSKITDDINLARSSISRSMKELEENELLYKELNKGLNSKYFIKLPK